MPEPIQIKISFPSSLPEQTTNLIIQGLRLKSFQIDERDVSTQTTGDTTELTITTANERLDPPPAQENEQLLN